jgi:hypothetical protein
MSPNRRGFHRTRGGAADGLGRLPIGEGGRSRALQHKMRHNELISAPKPVFAPSERWGDFDRRFLGSRPTPYTSRLPAPQGRQEVARRRKPREMKHPRSLRSPVRGGRNSSKDRDPPRTISSLARFRRRRRKPAAPRGALCGGGCAHPRGSRRRATS